MAGSEHPVPWVFLVAMRGDASAGIGDAFAAEEIVDALLPSPFRLLSATRDPIPSNKKHHAHPGPRSRPSQTATGSSNKTRTASEGSAAVPDEDRREDEVGVQASDGPPFYSSGLRFLATITDRDDVLGFHRLSMRTMA